MKRPVLIALCALSFLISPREAQSEPDPRLNSIRRDIQAASTDPARLPSAIESLERIFPGRFP
ncbi:MAG: hypothetical protein WCL50_19955, partial [Spirochaetota bacterium]